MTKLCLMVKTDDFTSSKRDIDPSGYFGAV